METTTITVKKTIQHHGFFGDDWTYGQHDPEYRNWVEKMTGKKWEGYSCGDWATDSEMLDDFCTENNKSFRFIYCEEADGFYKVDKIDADYTSPYQGKVDGL